MLVAGVDVSERRGQTVALLDGNRLAVAVETVPTAADVVRLVGEHGVAVVAVDAPLRPSRLLLREPAMRDRWDVPDRPGLNGRLYANYRICDYELIRRGMPLYQVPATEQAAAGWMRVGFALARLLTAAGYRVPRHAWDYAATLVEVFPDAAFVTLAGARPARKTGRDGGLGRAQRRQILLCQGVALPATASHDALDAAAAALTGLRWRQGRGCALGHPDEGLIVLPVEAAALRERYH